MALRVGRVHARRSYGQSGWRAVCVSVVVVVVVAAQKSCGLFAPWPATRCFSALHANKQHEGTGTASIVKAHCELSIFLSRSRRAEQGEFAFRHMSKLSKSVAWANTFPAAASGSGSHTYCMSRGGGNAFEGVSLCTALIWPPLQSRGPGLGAME